MALEVDLVRVAANATAVAVLSYAPRRSRGVRIVAGHGYSSSKQNLDLLSGFLASHGFGVFSLDFPGHKLGASGGILRGARDLTGAMSAVIAYVRERFDGPLYAAGHSMGALTALLCAAADPGVAGVISIATGFQRARALEKFIKGGAADFRSSYVDGAALPDLMRETDALIEGAQAALAGRPQLYVAADRDAMVSPASVAELYERAPQPKEFVTVASDHTYAAENARSEILKWLDRRHPRA